MLAPSFFGLAQPHTRGWVFVEMYRTDLAGHIRLSTNEAGEVTLRHHHRPVGAVDAVPVQAARPEDVPR
jgi:hypothetical protein